MTLSFRQDRDLWLAADAAPRFEEFLLDPTLHVRELGARVDVPILRFAHASIILRASGPVALLLRREGREPLVIAREEGRIDLAGRCSGVDDGEPLDVEVDADGVTVHAGVEGAPLVCAVEVGARFGISVQARSLETRLSSISIARR